MRIQHLEIPAEFGECKERWRDLTSGGHLFNCLQLCTTRRAGEEEFKEVLDHLDRWQEYVLTEKYIPSGAYQWNRARELAKLAQLASTQPPAEATQRIERIFLPHLSAWQWDAVCALRSIDRSVLPNTATSISVLMEQGNRGYLARLDVELMADGNGELYADPRTNWFVEFETETFLKAASDEWKRINGDIEPAGNRLLESVDARFRLTLVEVPGYPSPELVVANGRSAQLAFHLCLKRSADVFLGNRDAIFLDTSVAASATIEGDLKLGGVGTLDTKMRAAYLNDLAIVIVANDDEAKAKSDLESSRTSVTPQYHSGAIEVVGCDSIADAFTALRKRAKEKLAVRRHEYELCNEISLLYQSVSIGKHYQVLPLLQEVKRERLPRTRKPGSVDVEDDRFTGLRASELHRWEESNQEDQVVTEQYALKNVFSDFRGVVKRARSTVPRFFLQGPPGSGKSTLTQYLAWACTFPLIGRNGDGTLSGLRNEAGVPEHLVPARVTLREWEKWATKETEPEQSLPEYLAHHNKDLVNAPASVHWRNWLRRGEVLLLFDGLDEIEGDSRFVDALKRALFVYSNCPTVLTCRTVSREQHRSISSELPIFTLAGLKAEQRDSFIRSFPVGEGNGFDPEALVEQLNGDVGMRPLAANPLLLSIICYVMAEPGLNELPETRGDFYDQAIDNLLQRTSRVKVKYPQGNPLTLTEKRRILERVALTLFAGMDGQRRLTFSEASLFDALKCAAEQEGYGKRPAPFANALLREFVRNCGILRGDAERGYFFLHLTLQEFLAASAIARVVNKEGWQAEIRLADRSVTPRCIVECKSWDPRWSEVIKLFAGQLRDPSLFLNLLADENSDDWLGHRLALAAMCLPEIKAIIRHALAKSINQITEAAFSSWWKHNDAGSEAAVDHLTKALPALAQAKGCVKDIPLLTLLRSWLELEETDKVSARAAEASEQRCQPPLFYPRLAALLHDASSDVRVRAAKVLGQMGEAAARHPDVLPALIERALRAGGWVSSSATHALGRMREGIARHPEALLASVERALREDHADVIGNAAEVLAELGEAVAWHPKVLAALVNRALYDHELYARFSAVRALGKLGEAAARYPEVLPALVKLARDDDENMRQTAAEALGRMGEAAARHPEVLAALVDRALNDDEWFVRGIVVKILGTMGAAAPQHPEVLAALFDRALHDDEWFVRESSAVALVNKGEASRLYPEILAALVERALRADEWFGRESAAKALGEMGAAAGHPEVLAALVNRALHDDHVNVRRGAVDALGKLGEAVVARHPDVLAALVDRALHDEQVDARIGAVVALAGLGEVVAGHPEVLTALVYRVLHDDHRVVRENAAKALGRMGEAAAAHPEVLAALVDRALHDDDLFVRGSAAEALGEMGAAAAGDPEFISAFMVGVQNTGLLVEGVLASDLVARGVLASFLGKFMILGKRLVDGPSASLMVKTVHELSAWERCKEFGNEN